ncbi:molybdopterin-binding protein [Caulobacter sp. KR2-114]|uniref:molybdopterin-binding protein n=1 Tax=Caulobacter sp. KR2-114 TaxID=3400912 RepID=UPI003C0AA91F
MPVAPLDRRRLLGALAAAAAVPLAACDRLSRSPAVARVLERAETVTRRTHRLIQQRLALAPEFAEADISADFRANGTTDPDDAVYRALAADQFADWRLEVGGLVERPLSLALGDLRRRPARTQITRHDCVEGWSGIAKWTGVPLADVLAQARLLPTARYVVFHCADSLEQTLDGTGQYYESLDLIDAHHPQTILAYAMNGHPLPIAHGAPLRLRVERQLGYKMAKYVMRIEAVDSLAPIGRGKGGFWEDRGYEWYAGV